MSDFSLGGLCLYRTILLFDQLYQLILRFRIFTDQIYLQFSWLEIITVLLMYYSRIDADYEG